MALKLPEGGGDGCESSIFGIFAPEKRDDVIVNVKDLDIEPHLPIQPNSRTVSFRIEPMAQWLLLSETRFEATLKIVKASDGTDISPRRSAAAATASTGAVTAYESAGFDQMPINLAIRTVDVRANNAVLSTVDNNYGITAYVITLMNYDRTTLDTKGESMGFYLETSPESLSLTDYDGHRKRYQNTRGSLAYQLSSPIFSPLFCINKALIPMVRLSVDFYLQDARFIIKSAVPAADCDFDYQISDAKLVLKAIYVTSDFTLRFERQLAAGQNAIYDIENFMTKAFLIGAGRAEYSVSNPFDSSFIPTKVIVFFGDQDQSVGQFGNSPLSFKPRNVKNIRVLINDSPCPSIPFNLNWATNKFIRAFQALMGDNFSPTITAIDKNMFRKEHCFFCFDMLKWQCGAPGSKSLGNCKIEIEFVNTNNPILKCYVFFIQQEQIQITANREIIKNY